MSEAEEKVTKKKPFELRCDLREGFCCVCVKKLPMEGAMVVKTSRVLGLDKGSMPDCFSVCGPRCAQFLDSKDKLARPSQRVLLRRMSSALLGTDVLVGDRVRTLRDFSANRKIEAGEGTVHNIVKSSSSSISSSCISSSSSSSSSSVLDSERGCGEILVKMAVGGPIVHVWPSGLSRVADDDADGDAGRSRPVKAAPQNVLAELCQNRLARIGELEASVGAQKQRAVGAVTHRRDAEKLRNELKDAADSAREKEERYEAESRRAQRHFFYCNIAVGSRS
jgi:hypothetical protein